MATARRATCESPRDTYSAKLRNLIATYCTDAEMFDASPWPIELARLLHGETVEVDGWQCGLGAGRWRLDADGTVTQIG